MTYTEQQITDCFAELKRQSRDGRTIDAIYWPPLNAIAGPRSFEVVFLLQNRGLLREQVLPGCYGHSVNHFTA